MNRTLAHFFSVTGLPVLVLTYVLLLMLSISPFAFGANDMFDKRSMVFIMGVFITSALIPAIGMLLMKGLGFIQTWQMEDKQDRTGPYIMSGVFYLWLFKNLISGGQTPILFTAFVLGATVSLFLCFFLNIFTKVSAHAAGMGGFVTMLLLLPFHWSEAGEMVPLFGLMVSWPVVIALGILLAGAVGAARLALKAHTPADLYRGYLVGIFSVLLAVYFLD
jgi:hypothetical protein